MSLIIKKKIEKARCGVARHIVQSLSHILPNDQYWKIKLLQNWHVIIGSLHNKVNLHKVGDDHVVLTVQHPSLAQELLYLSELLREKINTALDRPRIKALHFRTGVKASKETKTPAKKSPLFKPVRKNATLSGAEKKALLTIENKDLRAALSQFYITCKQRQ